MRLTLRNTGAAGTILNGTILLQGSNFSTSGSNFSLTSGQSFPVPVTSTRTASGLAQGTLTINSNDPANLSASVPLVASDSISRVKVWLNAFIPRLLPYSGLIFQPTMPAPPPYDTWTMLRGPLLFAWWFRTDNRFFSNDPLHSSRMHSEIEIDTAGPHIINGPSTGLHRADETVAFLGGTVACSGHADTTRMTFSNLRGSLSTTIQIDLTAAAKDPCTPQQLTPDLDYNGTITIDNVARQVRFDGFIDEFPAFEMYASVNGGPPKSIFIRLPNLGQDPWNLMGKAPVAVSGTASF